MTGVGVQGDERPNWSRARAPWPRARAAGRDPSRGGAPRELFGEVAARYGVPWRGLLRALEETSG
jgi:hypothetical protein